MNTIYSTDEFNVYQDKIKITMFTITNTTSTNQLFKPLFNSIVKTNIINNSTIITENNEIKSFIFKALSVKSFYQFKEEQYKLNGSEKIQYNLILKIIYSLSKQIHYLLNNESKCFYKLDVSNILVIDDSKFIYLSHEDLNDVKEKKIFIYRPISKTHGYLSRELKNANSIPISINYKTIYYSLGLLILDNNININTDEEINILLDNELKYIKDTKLYYFLKRCLCNDPNKRFLLYV
jgi:hypothetical protein